VKSVVRFYCPTCGSADVRFTDATDGRCRGCGRRFTGLDQLTAVLTEEPTCPDE
jgi:hypothetical protein